MKQRLIAGIFLLLACSICNIVRAESDSRVIWGIKASVDTELPGKWSDRDFSIGMYKPGLGFSLGGVCNVDLGRNFYVEPGVSLFYSQYNYKDLYIIDDEGTVSEKNPKLYKWGLNVPVLVGYTIDFSENFSMNVFTGPQLRYAFAGDIVFKNKSNIAGLEEDFNLFGDNGQRRVSCDWKIGIGFPVDNFNISIEADLGISDLFKNQLRFRENRLGVGVTYFF